MSENLETRLASLEKKYRFYRDEAKRVREENQGIPVKDEVDSHLKAAETAEQIVKEAEGILKEKYEGYLQREKEAAARIIEELKRNKQPAAKVEEGGKVVEAKAAAPEKKAGDADPSWYKEKPGHGLDDVTGMDRVKGRLKKDIIRMKRQELLDFLDLGKVSGFLFYGPPGCGKTFITEAFVSDLMGEDYKYLSLDASQIHSKYSGEAEKIVAGVFQETEKAAPAILFFDEIEAVCTERQLPDIPQHIRSLTTSFLTSYNHLKDCKKVFLIGATNFPQNVDGAMLSRMELIRVPLPDHPARKNYFTSAFDKAHLKLAEDVNTDYMASRTMNYSYRDMGKIVTAVKKEIFDMLDDVDEKKAIRELMEGHCFITRGLFDSALRSVLPTYDREYMNALTAWEKDHGIEPEPPREMEDDSPQDKGAQYPKAAGTKPGGAAADGSAGRMGGGTLSLLETIQPAAKWFEKVLGKDLLRFHPGMGMQGEAGIPGWSFSFPAGMNNHPYLDLFYAYLCSAYFFRGSAPDHYSECSVRLLEAEKGLVSEVTTYREAGILSEETAREFLDLLEGILPYARKEASGKPWHFSGFRFAGTVAAYDGYNTGRQGEADPRFG